MMKTWNNIFIYLLPAAHGTSFVESSLLFPSFLFVRHPFSPSANCFLILSMASGELKQRPPTDNFKRLWRNILFGRPLLLSFLVGGEGKITVPSVWFAFYFFPSFSRCHVKNSPFLSIFVARSTYFSLRRPQGAFPLKFHAKEFSSTTFVHTKKMRCAQHR